MTAIEFPTVLTDRVISIRPLREGDAGDYAQAFRDDPELGRLQGSQTDPDEDAVRERARRSTAGAREGQHIELAILDAGTDEFIGGMILLEFDWGSRRCEVGYWLTLAARGRGLATAACTLVIDWVLTELDFLRVEIATTPENVPSMQVARRLGFTEEALQRQRDIERGRRVDVIQFGLLREEWLPRRTPAGR
jgi:RimJ/RimL family protein N-acetyltransferase